MSALEIPPGYGFQVIRKENWYNLNSSDPEQFTKPLMGKLIIWEAPRKGFHYILGVDVSGGIGQDRSVVDVLRAPTLAEPAEQVAQYITDEVEPVQLAYIIDPIGRFYKDDDGQEALAAIEMNNHGLSTQSELQGHLGYSNFYIWQRLNLRDPSRRYSSVVGWYTTRQTRPMLIDFFRSAVNTVDPLSGASDIILNSPFTFTDMMNFQAPDGYPAYMAAAADGCTDDTVFSCMIALYISHMERYNESEPLHEQRRRLHEEKLRKQFEEENTGMRRSYQSTAVSADEMWGEGEQFYAREGSDL